MKNKMHQIIPFTLTMALALTGCAASDTGAASGPAAKLSAVPAATANEVSVPVAAGANPQTETVKTLSASAGESAAAVDEEIFDSYFSDRDLSGEYDRSEAVTIRLKGSTAECGAEGVKIEGSTVTVTQGGTYLLSGELNGSIIVNATKDDKIQLVLDGAAIHAEDFAAIYVLQADKVFVTLADGTVNTLSNGGTFTQIDENDVDAVVFSKDDITFNGTGSLKINAPGGHGISGKDEVTVTDGRYEITAAHHAIRAKDSLAIADGTFILTADEDGLHAENGDDDSLGNIYLAGGDYTIEVDDDAIHANTLLQIDGGTFDITAAEGLEGTLVRINGGEIGINASDDGINAAYKSSAYVPTFEINGGQVTIVMGEGDTDGIDSNGNIVINGGTLDITGQSAVDYDGNATYNSGTLIINGQQVTAIPNQEFGGRGTQGGGRGGLGNRMPGSDGQAADGSGMPSGGRGGFGPGMPPDGEEGTDAPRMMPPAGGDFGPGTSEEGTDPSGNSTQGKGGFKRNGSGKAKRGTETAATE